MNNLKTIAYNLIVMLFDQIGDDYQGLDDPEFKAYACSEAGISEDLFDEIMSDSVGDNTLMGKVETTAGTLRVYQNTDPGAPGVAIMLQPTAYDEEIDVALVEVVKNPDYGMSYTGSPEDVSIKVWGDATTEDYTTSEIISREAVIAGLGTGGMV